MVQDIGEGRIKLEFVLDRAELESQLGQVFRATDPSGGGMPAGPAGGRARDPLVSEERRVERSDRREERSDSKKSLRYLAMLGGIALGITAMVKSSQVLTSTLGALNSVLGGMIDSFLAPLVPLLMPAIQKLAEFIPAAAAAGAVTAEGAADIITGLRQVAGSEGGDVRNEVLGGIGKTLLDMLTPQMFGKDLYRSPPKRRLEEVQRIREEIGMPEVSFLERSLKYVKPETLRETMQGRREFYGLGTAARGEGGNTFNILAPSIEETTREVGDRLTELQRDSLSRGYSGG